MTVSPVDRAAAVRSAVRTLVARNGFHGASMSAAASEAGRGDGHRFESKQVAQDAKAGADWDPGRVHSPQPSPATRRSV